MKSVYCAVRIGSLNKAVCASSLKGYCTKTLSLVLPGSKFDDSNSIMGVVRVFKIHVEYKEFSP